MYSIDSKVSLSCVCLLLREFVNRECAVIQCLSSIETVYIINVVSNPSQPPSVTLTNTRQIGVKHSITLVKATPTSSLGFGVTSRDVMTDNQNVPFYIKSITSGECVLCKQWQYFAILKMYT